MTESEQPIRFLASFGASLTPDDSLSHAVEALQHAPAGAVPVLAGGRLVGLVSDREVAIGLCRGNGTRVGDVMATDVPPVLADTPLRVALGHIADSPFPAVPVVMPDGLFLGAVGRSELLAAVARRRRPASVGGMATPLGVYLTDGSTGAGAGFLGLMLTGVFLFAGSLVANGVAFTAMHYATRAGLTQVVPGVAWGAATFLAVFALWFRLSPLAGYHAAEHQTVHAIERNESLTPEAVARMPRPHPRCGTNIAVAGVMFTSLVEVLRVDALLAGLFSLATYRVFGRWVQAHITTRPASAKQIASGIQAGEELLERFQSGRGGYRRGGLRRLWNSGLLQVASGYAVCAGLFWVAARYVPFVGRLVGPLQ